MSEPHPGPAPVDRRDAGPPRLARAPGERYGAGAGASSRPPGGGAGARQPEGGSPGLVRALVAADVVAAGGALVILALGLGDLGPAMLAASAAIGWAVALALMWGGIRTSLPGTTARMALAGGLGAGAVVVGLLLVWAWGRVEGGVLDPIAYVDTRFGLLAWADVIVAAAAGALRAR